MRNIVLAALVAFASPAAGQSWAIEAFVGDAYNFRTRLEVEDRGMSRSVRADYETRGFDTPLYYVLRAARWQEGRAWEASLIHHKLYLRNPPEGVSDLSISHGFNIIAVARAERSGDWTWRIGAGPVVTHAEATINGVRYDGPYRLSGVALLAGGGLRRALGRSWFVSAELMATAAYARPKLSGEAEIRASNVALHALAGLGVELR